METVIKWNKGEGNIVATYNGSGNGPIQFTTNHNEGLDREQRVTVKTTKGDLKTVSVLIKQDGLREEYITADGEVYLTADGEIYGCLK